jgi:hypothetical protein
MGHQWGKEVRERAKGERMVWLALPGFISLATGPYVDVEG